jgi:hypothetical protein
MHGAHLDEDRLAAWILEGDEGPGDEERAHLEACPICSKRVEALRRLAVSLEDLRADASIRESVAIPEALSGRSMQRAQGRRDRVWALVGVAAVAVFAWIVPRSGPVPPEGSWTGHDVASRVEERTIELMTQLPETFRDSLLTFSLVSEGPGSLAPMRFTSVVAGLEREERRVLYQILQDELSRARSSETPEQGGGI